MGENSVGFHCAASEKGSALKGKNLLTSRVRP